jgi:hypothetical protein
MTFPCLPQPRVAYEHVLMKITDTGVFLNDSVLG